MRVTLLGFELINLSTASHLAKMGYEVTLIDSRTENDAKTGFLKASLENISFIKEIESKLLKLGVIFRYNCIATQYTADNKMLRNLSIINEFNQSEIIVSDKFIVALNPTNLALLKSMKIYSPSQFKPFNTEGYRNPLIGKSYYSNLYLNVGQGMISQSTVFQSGSALANFIYNPLHHNITNTTNHSVKNNDLKSKQPLISKITKKLSRFFKYSSSPDA